MYAVRDEKLEEMMEEHSCDHFLQNSPPCHKAKVVTKGFQERPHITLIKWPGKSPDLNPIENCWIWMKKQLKENNTSIPELEESIKRLWKEKMSDCTYLESLVRSMPRRMVNVIESISLIVFVKIIVQINHISVSKLIFYMTRHFGPRPLTGQPGNFVQYKINNLYL